MPELAIIGGGLVGLCAALVLQHPARRVTVIEAADLNQAQTSGLNARSIALSTSSQQIFRALGIWPALAAQAAAIRKIHISARGHWGVTRLRAADYELDALGYVIENQLLTQVLLDAVQASANIELIDRSSFESIVSGSCVEIGYRRNNQVRQLEASFALLADGANSPARDALGIGHHKVDYGQSVVICNLEVSRPLDDSAYERFTSEGPLAMLPLGGRRYASVWTLAPELAAHLCAQTDADFRRELQDCFGYRLGLIEALGQRFSIPIIRTRADALQSGRCLLIGNAANALHPVAGQSFNLALRDVACLYELLVDEAVAELSEQRLADIAETYETQRKREQQQVIRYGDGLVSLFSNELPLVDHLRAAGLGLLDLLPALKTQAAFTGMGLSFGGNRLLRGHL